MITTSDEDGTRENVGGPICRRKMAQPTKQARTHARTARTFRSLAGSKNITRFLPPYDKNHNDTSEVLTQRLYTLLVTVG
jgi:hypothetical protein